MTEPGSEVREILIQLAYLASSVLFILGLRGLSDPAKARNGMRQAMVAMLLAVIGTLLHHDIVRFDFLLVGLLVGSIIGVVIGLPLGIDIPMTAMPQFVAISHMFGAVAATLVGIDEYRALGNAPATPVMAALGFEVILGALTVTGSFNGTRVPRCFPLRTTSPPTDAGVASSLMTIPRPDGRTPPAYRPIRGTG